MRVRDFIFGKQLPRQPPLSPLQQHCDPGQRTLQAVQSLGPVSVPPRPRLRKLRNLLGEYGSVQSLYSLSVQETGNGGCEWRV